METPNHSTIANGEIHFCDHVENVSDIAWIKHPQYQGVYLKHLIKGNKTGSHFSSHLVKIDPHCTLKTHNHTEQWELHEILDGHGTCHFEGNTIDYHFGKMAIIPKGVDHQVQASEKGMTLLAKFFPAIV